MRKTSFAAASIFTAAFLFLAFATSIFADETFLECLKTCSAPNHPISAATYTPRNASYSAVLEAYIRNLRFNRSTTPKPLFIVTALHVSHIQAAVVCGKKHALQMRIRSGGHDYEGVSYVSDDPFFVLDMFNFRAININVEEETAWVEVGATTGELYYRIAEKTNVHAFPSGVCTTLGLGGHFSGGGYGNLIKKYGLSVDNILDAQLVDVNGRLLNRASMGEDFFWAIGGGGGSSFGVIIAFKIRLVRVPPKVTVFQVERTYEQNATNLAHRWQQIAPKLHGDLFIRMTVDVVSRGRGKTIRTLFNALFLGNSVRLLSLMNQSFPELGLERRDCIEMRWVESTLFWFGLPRTSLEVLLNRIPQSRDYSKSKSDFLKKPMSKAAIKALFKKMIELETPFMQFNPYGARMSEIQPSAKPFPHRGHLIKMLYLTSWTQSGIEAANRFINLSRTLHDFMTPFVTKSPRQAFLNYRDFDIGINHHGRNSYKEGLVYGLKYFMGNFDRLVQIKTKVDPENYFRNEQSIPVFPSGKKDKLKRGISYRITFRRYPIEM